MKQLENLNHSELKELLEDKIKSLRKLEAKIENMYEIGAHDIADDLEMISDVVVDDIIEIESLLKQTKK